MEYSKELTNEEYVDNFKCCKNCPSWSSEGDYTHNHCLEWHKKGKDILTHWAIFCEHYSGDKTNEGTHHKIVLHNNVLTPEYKIKK